MAIQLVKGTKDLYGSEVLQWQALEQKIRQLCAVFGIGEMRTPMFEFTELFARGVGETTDIVQKEMYTFTDDGNRSLTLRPEGTAGAVRAYLENGMASKPSPVKLYYNMAMYRYENVQKGRLREFHQIGAELIGSSSYLADVDTILMAKSIFDTLNIPNIKLNINSIGCPKCRSEYQKKLREFIGKNLDSYCDTCKTRFEKNPMRILDCKEKKCKELNVGAPMMIDYLCEECKEHFENVKSALSSANVEFEIDSSIVRGLDYYTKTVFEFIDDKTGLTVLGGGRYDGLVEEFGGASTPAVGFATGVERVMELFEATNEQVQENVPDLYIVSCGDKENIKSIEIAENLRKAGVYVEKDIMERSFKAQFKYADKLNCKNVIVIGEDELTSGKVKVKNMATGEEVEAELAPEAIINIIK